MPGETRPGLNTGGSSTRVIAVTLALAGLALCTLSWWFNHVSEAWWASVLANLGAAVLVFAPLYWATRILDLRIEGNRRQTEDLVHGVSDRLDEISSGQGRQLALLTEELKNRRAEATLHVSNLTAEFRDDPTREALATLHSHAVAEGLLRASPHARVEAAQGIFIQVPASYLYGDPVFRVTTLDGRQIAAVTWRSTLTATHFWGELSSAVEAITSHALDVEKFLKAYTRLVELAATHHNLKGAVCLFEPQWMLCHMGLVPVDHPLEPLGAEIIQDPEARAAIMSKDWVDIPSFKAALAAVDSGMHG